MKNQLSNSFSPYLLQHSGNPVYWQIWNDENLNQAKTSNKLLIISIGYAACHWCHVMEKECFEDTDVAKVMNDHFTSFKIDREELPAIDAYYMQALQLMTKQGGWPLNIVALPNGLPVWGATYVPKEQWIDVLEQLEHLFASDPEKMYEYAEKLNQGISLANDTLEIYPKNSDQINIQPLLENWQKSFDLEYGGYQRAPKFMMPTNLNFLYDYGAANHTEHFKKHVILTLTKMAYGGLFDVIEGGFSRYSVDHKWRIPHFEKMLYDNAQLLTVYSKVYIDTKIPLFKEVLSKTTRFILENWKDDSGGFYAAFDADSLTTHNILQEGAYYIWTKEELQQIIPKKDWQLFADVFSINHEGYWEEANAFVLFQRNNIETIASTYTIQVENLKLQKAQWEQILRMERNKRNKPLLDDKLIISWNAQLLTGFLHAQKVISDKDLVAAIDRLTYFLQNKAFKDGKLGHVHKNNSNYIQGILEDYAFTIDAFIQLFNRSQNTNHLNFARELTLIAIDLFFDERQGFFKSAENKTVGTVFEIEDNVIPSANAVMAKNLFYLGFLFKNKYFSSIATQMTERVLAQINYASAFSEWLSNDLLFKHTFEYVVTKDAAVHELAALNKKNHYKIILDNSLNIPILEDYKNQTKKFQVCNATSCRLLTNDIQKI